ncbi:helix-turn-helix transcriptional regulator [bacterium]|nr:helix-turn-helix transcriptional regulator [bacterium]
MNKYMLQKLAARIKELRKKKGLTQDDLAYYSNIPRSTIGHIETAQNDVVFSKVVAIANAFGLSLSDFLNF